MRTLLVLKHIKVEGANAIAGHTYGFPAVTHFLGFVHALSREFNKGKVEKLEFGGCGIICHGFEIQSKKIGWADHIFSLAKSPLTKEGNSAPFNEEGKVHIDVSLVIECKFSLKNLDFGTFDEIEDLNLFKKAILALAYTKRLAGGCITEIGGCEVATFSDDEKGVLQERSLLMKLLPGFALLDNSEVFNSYLKESSVDKLEAFIETSALRFASSACDEKVSWEILPRILPGWVVPVQIGYKAISPLYKEGEVLNARDRYTPFRFVEPLYGLAEWAGLHRIKNIESIFWNYKNTSDLYLCTNKLN